MSRVVILYINMAVCCILSICSFLLLVASLKSAYLFPSIISALFLTGILIIIKEYFKQLIDLNKPVIAETKPLIGEKNPESDYDKNKRLMKYHTAELKRHFLSMPIEEQNSSFGQGIKATIEIGEQYNNNEDIRNRR